MAKKYSIRELIHLRNHLATMLDSDFWDDKDTTDYYNFKEMTDDFFEWLNKTKKKTIKEILKSMPID